MPQLRPHWPCAGAKLGWLASSPLRFSVETCPLPPQRLSCAHLRTHCLGAAPAVRGFGKARGQPLPGYCAVPGVLRQGGLWLILRWLQQRACSCLERQLPWRQGRSLVCAPTVIPHAASPPQCDATRRKCATCGWGRMPLSGECRLNCKALFGIACVACTAPGVVAAGPPPISATSALAPPDRMPVCSCLAPALLFLTPCFCSLQA